MKIGFRPYPGYKTSGVPWVGSIPAHWGMRRAKFLFRSRKELNVGQVSTNVLSLTLRGVVNNDPDNPEGLVPASYDSYQLFRQDDLVFKLIDLENLRTSRVGLVHEDGIMSSAYIRLSLLKPGSVRFFYWQFFDLYLRGVYNQLGAGVRATLGPSDLLDISLVLPPEQEQSKIVRFVDYIERRIRRYLRAKQRLIALLSEQRRAIIDGAVTHGLDRDVRLRPSGVAWLGSIPEHWEVRRMKHLLSEPLKYGANEPADFSDRSWPRYIRITDVDGQGNLNEDTFRSLPEALARPYLLSDGDILFARSGATVGKTFIYSRNHGPAAHAGYLVRARPKTTVVHPQYLYSFLQSPGYWRWISSVTIQATIQNVSAEKYSNLSVPLPPLEEQRNIARFLGEETRSLVLAQLRATEAIRLMSEYRQRLAVDLVTGKLDVRRAELPDELEEGEEEHCRVEEEEEPMADEELVLAGD